MKHRRGVGLLFGLGLAVALTWTGTARAGHIYGGYDTNHILVPFFAVDFNDAAVSHRNVLVVAENLDTNTPNTFPVGGIANLIPADFHVILFGTNSVEACDACVPQTAGDVLSTSIEDIIKSVCSTQGKSILDPDADGVFRGYAVVELDNPGSQCAAERDNDFGMVGYVYDVQLANGQAAGYNAPGYFDSVFSASGTSGLNAFSLLSQERLFFRFLVSLGGNPNRAQTEIIIWSATTGGCNIGGVKPDSACLTGESITGALNVCDENEICTSQNIPSTNNEVNFFLADNIVPNTFATGGGYFELFNDPAKSAGNTLSVLGYADNQAIGVNPNLNWEVIFPAQREISQ